MPRTRRSQGSPFHSPPPNPNPNNNPTNNPIPHAQFSVQKIPFLPAHPAGWFRILENQFTAARINEESIKCNHVIGMLDSAMLEKFMDLIENLDPNTPYTNFKSGVISRMAVSEQSRLQQVLLGTDLGDRKPSELLSKMQSLAGDSIKSEALKTLWLRRLPSQVRAILAVSSEELPQLALLGDKIMETMSYQCIESAATSVSSVSATSKLEEQISQLSKEFSRFRNDNQSFRNSSNNRSRSKSQDRNQEKICYYHKRFGINAKKCTKWCTFNRQKSQSNSNSSENSWAR